MHDFPEPHHLPCPACGQSVARDEQELHVCEEDRRLDYELVQDRHEVTAFEEELAEWLDSPAGRFAAWLAERER